MTPPRCPYCQTDASLDTSPSSASGVLWVCPTPGCDSSIGVVDGPMPWPNGTMANPALRKLRARLYAIYTARINKFSRRQKQRLPLLGERRRINFLREEACQKLLMDLVAGSVVAGRNE